MLKKILLSLLCGLLILVITWAYQNYDHTYSVEDSFFKNVILTLKNKIYPQKPKYKTDFVFINTGKDLALVADTASGWGNIVVSDREKIYKLVRHINYLDKPPLFTVLDIQFYYPYSANPQIDTLLEKEVGKNSRLLIPVLKDKSGNYIKPLYKGLYGTSNYTTYGSTFNKFRILNQGKIPSIAVALQNAINKTVYKEHFFYATCNDSLCLSAIWPTYYITESDVREVAQQKNIQEIKKEKATYKDSLATFYEIGELLIELDANAGYTSKIFENKIVIIGNFQDDMHSTRAGKMSGPVLLANIYLSLLNRQHIINLSLLFILLLAFSALSYVALFSKMPEIRFKFRFIFSQTILKFIRKYLSYFGSMFILSIFIVVVYNVQIALFIPSFIFAFIAYSKEILYQNIAPFVSKLNTYFIRKKIISKQ